MRGEIRIISYALSWDWKTQPNWVEVEEAIIDLFDNGYRPAFYEIETGSDQYALLISSEHGLSESRQIEIYDQTRLGHE